VTLTAVEEFARLHDAGGLPAHADHYRSLLPTALPREGEQFAFAVDLDACTGCKACVVACHSLNGLDDDESWRSVGLIQGGREVAFQQTVTTACHHCVEPACLSGCPVDAYEKDAVTGIVSHLDDQCIGCSYCTLTCPYEVPRFNKERGIVRKCDMCRGRLEDGEAPACVQACPNGAITITIVSKAEVQRAASADPSAALVPGAPLSSLTSPTTTYTTRREVPADARAADHFSLRPAHLHPPLAVMLVLTQLAVGALAFDVVTLGRAGAHIAAATGAIALLASTLHLGRPLYAFRALLGVRHSWLSREILLFAAFAFTTPAYAISGSSVVGAAALAAGIAGVACSVMLYAVTGRTWWRPARSTTTFVLSGCVTGGLTTGAWLAISDELPLAASVAGVAAVAGAVKLVLELAVFRHLRDREVSDLKRAALLLRRDLFGWVQSRALAGLGGGVVIPLVVARAGGGGSAAVVGAALGVASVITIAGELIERNLFFAVAVAPRMPGELG
jgi:Fe-S-cluster-containing dehydrogenase component/DMSO reductase anchor subunit